LKWWRRTFADFDAFLLFVVHGSGALFKELVALNAEVDDFCALDGKLDELLGHVVHDVGGGLLDDESVEEAHRRETGQRSFDLV
jgi:hypothetical protein